MNAVRRIATGIIVLVAILFVVSFFLPSQWSVERSSVIKAPPEAIFVHLNSFKNWKAWSPWEGKDPQMTMSYEGPEEGVGAATRWDSPKMGKGTMTLTESVPPQKVVYDLDISEGKYRMKGSFTLTPGGEGTTVTWRDEGDVGKNPIGKYFALLMPRMIAKDFDEGLANLKKLLEGGPQG
ncbi:MAG: SRPBCC family protein [Nitrospirae bacterium]|nr:SRPBCC family protein [Nitrospirota bacterium]